MSVSWPSTSPRATSSPARRLRLMTNNMRKYVGLEGYGLEIVERVPVELQPNEHNREYLRTKKLKMGHLLKSV